MALMLSWRSDPDTDGATGLESARITTSGDGFRAVGRMIRGTAEGVLTASYRLVVAGDGTPSRLAVDVATAAGEQQVTISRSAEGVWLVDDGSGGTQRAFGDARDVDLAFSPVFNALPIRRLGLHREPAEHVLTVVVVDLPTLTVEAAEQTYRTVRTGTGAEPAVVGFEAGEFSAELTVDADGFVLDHPGIAARAELR
ncbi:putative glycolipid-binding domain-containing protein [Pseudonocardia sp. C8]|uniref:putative glycolipid-binding domain-containing protein n=1 Tax=Pseudonocardia sp. C8 TaxID=2762759 RepID=UPI0016428465|nr:putative glycolipid-binding domain-containing protein [Pseudonocardia sp. C8]MBC3194237.1 putative glycolipid-binding domain-containing protein [Pseudonocardia sp. C8]